MNTFDYYTGAAYGTETGVNSEEIVNIPYTNSTHLAPSTYSNDTIAWNLEYNNPIVGGFTPMSAYQFNITFYSDPGLQLTRTNNTHSYSVSQGQLTSAWIEEYEYWFDWQNLAANTIAGTSSTYEQILPPEFTDLTTPESYVTNLTNSVVSAAGATDVIQDACTF